MDACEVREWLQRGALVSHVWLPVMSAFKLEERLQGDIKLDQQLCHWEGYVGISKHLCHRLFRFGVVNLRNFRCGEGRLYQLPETSQDIRITVDDLVILRE